MLNVFIFKFAVLVICLLCFCSGKHDNIKGITDLAEENDGKRLFIVTLDGTLVNAEQKTGQLHWKIKDHPIVQAASNNSNAISPIFLPDPIDGSLYLAGGDRKFKKLPFTIPQLVANSPCRSSDGILYTGKKTDTWYKLDPQSGNRQQVLGWDEANPICPVEMNKFIYIGKTKYDIMMVDSVKSKIRWNITFYDYTAAMMTEEDKTKYGFIHLASTSSGHLITIDKKNGKLLWDIDMGSPVVAVYLLDDDDSLISVPFTGVSDKTMYYLRNEILSKDIPLSSDKKINLYSSLYVGEHQHGLYVTPSLVDEDTVILPVEHLGQLQIEGPQIADQSILSSDPIPGCNYVFSKDSSNNGVDTNFQILPEFNHKNIYLGHYNLPQYSSQKVVGGTGGKLLLTDKSQNKIKKPENNNIIQTLYPDNMLRIQIPQLNGEKARNNFQSIYSDLKVWINQQENKGLKMCLIIMTGCVIAMFWHLQTQVRLIQNASQGSKSTMSSQSEHPEELADGMVKIGKIAFDPKYLLGKGCEGTFVYRGVFDNRKVAVKRLLPECFTFADREVALLRESDTHPNVIRYYCMEQDRMFRYIALELCQATLSDYIQGECKISSIEPLDILQQATSGLAHLHSLDIVHRDIKPHNVLLSLPDKKGNVKVMISDFGLCKKLQVGRISFSRRSGITGTDGWIAPEMINGSGRTTAAVDMFSLGCLFYYVLSRGSHPFGDVLSRQSNILLGVYNLTELRGEDWQKCIQLSVLLALLSPNPEQRPPAATVLKHPMFWNLEKISSFFQDVSDRVERAEPDSIILQGLESGGKTVVKFDWREHLGEELVSDLRKYRTYKGDSVRDLLRALRNKKHHFYELSNSAQKQLEENPNKLTEYWINTFPLLLAYVWTTMQCLSKENTFQDYFDASFVFPNSSLQNHIASYPSLRLCESDQDVHYKFTGVRKKQLNARNPKLRKKSNVNVTKSDNAKELTVDDSCGDTKLTKNKGPMELKKRKRKKKVEEPLFWSIES